MSAAAAVPHHRDPVPHRPPTTQGTARHPIHPSAQQLSSRESLSLQPFTRGKLEAVREENGPKSIGSEGGTGI